MTDLDKLERLVRLKESGGLTQEEFKSEKAKLLASLQSGGAKTLPAAAENWWLVGIGGVLVILLIALVILQSHPSKDTSGKAANHNLVGEAISDHLISGAADTQALSAGVVEGSYSWATSESLIGANPEYIEKVLGPPVQKDATSLFYNDLQGCIVNYLTKGSKITSIQIIITDKCAPEVKGRIITPQTTFGSVSDEFGFLQTSCLALCGNKADPTIEYVIPGPHSSNFIDVSYSTYDTDSSTIWENEITRANGVTSIFDVPDGALQCPGKPTQAAVAAMKNATVSSVTIGVDLEECVEW